jgi:hypothetical protein
LGDLEQRCPDPITITAKTYRVASESVSGFRARFAVASEHSNRSTFVAGRYRMTGLTWNPTRSMTAMKTILAGLLTLPLVCTAYADEASDSAVRWSEIAGVITAQGVDNPISTTISSGTFAWTARSGRALVDLRTGFMSFDVDGLVINGTAFSGTPGPVTAVTGTLVCNPGASNEVTHDSPPVPLSVHGNAAFSGDVANGPIACGNPLFLIRIAVPQGAAGRWIATGVQPATTTE